MTADKPLRGDESALSENTSVARDVLEMDLLERRVEDELVRARHRTRADARDRNVPPVRARGRGREGLRRSGRRVLLRRMMRLDEVRLETGSVPEQRRRRRGDLLENVHAEREIRGGEQ